MMSKEDLLHAAKTHYYKPEILEKVFRLMNTLKQFMAVPFLRERLALKGGTALNLFHFEGIPRLSVDIDLNYIGSIDKIVMQEERQLINDAIQQIFQQNQFELDRSPMYHAGGKMIWRYPSVLGQKGNLEVDLNYMYRKPLWPAQWLSPQLPLTRQFQMAVLDIHELAAGKLAALFDRQASRDLFDAHHLLTICDLNNKKLRLAFVIYIAITQVSLQNLKPEYINFNINDLHNRLLPVLRQQELPRSQSNLKQWAKKLLTSLHDSLTKILPLQENEVEFITQIRETYKIKPELLTDDSKLADIIHIHPAILWATLKHKK